MQPAQEKPNPGNRASPGTKAFDTLAMTGLLLLLLATALAAALAMHQLRSIAHAEAQARAQRVADSLAGRIGRALGLGVPLAELVGVPLLFDQRMQQVPGIAGLALADASGAVLWLQQPGESAAERLPLKPGSQQALPDGLRVTAAVRPGGNAAEPDVQPSTQTAQSAQTAQVVLVWQDLDAGSLLGKSLLPLLAWPMAVSVLAALALQRSLRRGRMRRDAALHQAIENVLAGDLSQPLPALRRQDFDPRPAWLADQLRFVNEQQLRITRLHHSLRQTEPDAQRRMALDAALADAAGEQRFRGAGDFSPGDLPAAKSLHFLALMTPRQTALRYAAWLCLGMGLLLPLLMAFAPQFLPGEGRAIEVALLCSSAGNALWLGWIFIRPAADPAVSAKPGFARAA